jgi:serine/threonine-protein kinase HipA
MKRLHLVSNDREIGHLDQDDGGTLRLLTPPADDAPRLSLAFSPSERPVRPRVARAWIEGLLPDSDQVREAIARRHGVSSNSPFALLEVIGRDCPGAVQFTPASHIDEPRDDQLVPISDAQIAIRLRALRTGRGASWLADGEHWSLGGAQGKFALRQENGQWYEAHGDAATTHIIKPGITELNSQALMEHVSLRTLDLAGVAVASTAFTRFAGEPAIVVERYDRIREAGAVYRVHQEDLCQATSTLPWNKYSVTAPQAIRVLRGGGASEGVVLRTLDAILVNWLLGAPDGHAKNLSVLLTPNDMDLAPLYDVSTGFGQDQRYLQMAIGIGGEKRFDRVTGTHVKRLARDADVSEDILVGRAALLAALLPPAFQRAAEEQAVHGIDRDTVMRADEELAAHCSRAIERL